MKKLVFVMIAFLFLTGCNQNPDSNTDSKDDEKTGNGFLDAQILKGASADNSVKLIDNGDGTSSVTLNNWRIILIPISEDERNHDLMSYREMTLDYQSSGQFRVSLFDGRGDNLKPPTADDGAEWSQWDYIGDGGYDGETKINITRIDREEIKYIGISAGEKIDITLRGIQFSRDNYHLQWDAQFAWYVKQIESSVNESSKITANEDGTFSINFLSENAIAKFPVGRMSGYNLSQYTEMVINGIVCTEGFRVSLFNSRDENIKPGAAENDRWWYTGNSSFSGNRIFNFKWLPTEELADASYVLINCTSSARKPLTIKGITFNGDARKSKTNLGTRPISLKVDCGSVIREVTHCASGALYGITGSLPADINALVKPLSPHVYTQPARSGSGFHMPSLTADALTVANRLKDSDTLVQIRLSDMLPGWPYNFPGMTRWLQLVENFVDDKLASGLDNFDGYEIWNETWYETNYGINFYSFWKQTYDLIRRKDPNAYIIGPSSAYYSRDRIKNFLLFCIENNCVPEIICWHELGTLANVSRNMRDYRDLEKELGLAELRISINEYGAGMDEREMEGCPGSHAAYVAKFERYKIDSANISWWFAPGTAGYLGSLLTNGSQKNGGWYFYQWYGEMSGKMVSVTPSNENSKTADGFACVDENKKYVSVLFGGANDGLIDVTITNLPSWLTLNPLVKVEKVDWVNRTSVSPGTVTISENRREVKNNSLTVSLIDCTDTTGYRIYICE